MPANCADDTFIRRARRTQLIEAAIAALARQGAEGASISAIAREAQVSRGTVTYHFTDLGDVVDQTISTIYARGRAAVRPRIDLATGPAAQLEAFLRGSTEFYQRHAHDVAALQVIFAVPLAVREQRPEHQREISELVELLRDGQRSGAFREFDAPLLAAVIRAALDTVIGRTTTPGDLTECADELVAVFARAVRP